MEISAIFAEKDKRMRFIHHSHHHDTASSVVAVGMVM